MPLLVAGGVVVGGVVIRGEAGVVGGGLGGGGRGMMDVVGGPVAWPAGVGGGRWVVVACELDVNVRGTTIAAAITTAVSTEMIVTRLVTGSP